MQVVLGHLEQAGAAGGKVGYAAVEFALLADLSQGSEAHQIGGLPLAIRHLVAAFHHRQDARIALFHQQVGAHPAGGRMLVARAVRDVLAAF